ncbi:hypothetical protein ACO1O0_005633 [Amphichorda felina]
MSSHALVLPVGVFTSKSDWTAAQLTATWVRLESQINPFNRVLNIPGDLFRTFDVGAKRFIANAFMLVISPKRMFWNADSRRQQTQEMVMFCRDGTGYDRYFLGNPRHFLGGNGIIMEVSDSEPFWFPCLDALEITRAAMTKPIVPPTKNKEKKIPRPPNAYILYRKERHTIVKEANPGITNNEISQVLGSAWNTESREVRQKYKDMADEIKRALLEAHPDYQYKPRKPSEKKRRARRNPQQTPSQEDGDALMESSPGNLDELDGPTDEL